MMIDSIILSDENKSLEIMVIDGVTTIVIDDPDYGDSETGFGASLRVCLTKQQVNELYQFLKGMVQNGTN